MLLNFLQVFKSLSLKASMVNLFSHTSQKMSTFFFLVRPIACPALCRIQREVSIIVEAFFASVAYLTSATSADTFFSSAAFDALNSVKFFSHCILYIRSTIFLAGM